MTKKLCINNDGCAMVAKGLCASCYNSKRHAEKCQKAKDELVRFCVYCGVTFSGRDIRAVYCSDECSEKAHGDRRVATHVPVAVTRPERICEWCDGPIDPSRQGSAKYCSQKCNRSAHWRRKRLERNRSLGRICAVCLEALDELAIIGTKYCSEACRHIKEKATKYGVDPAELYVILRDQKTCESCGTNEWGSAGPHIDHDHVTGVMRGLLCHGCNIGIGNFKENPAALRAAADYLERHLT